MNADINELEKLNRLTWKAITARRDMVTGCEIQVPNQVSTERQDDESRFDNALPVLRHLDQALSLAARYELAEIANKFSRVVGELRWSQNSHYTERNSSSSFLAGYAYAGFSGPDAPILCAVPRGGLLLLGPDVVYPGHHHEPREVYLLLTPGSQWCLDEGDWFDVSPGDLIFHNSWQMHAMRTFDKPLLAFAGWLDVGDRRAIDWSKEGV